MTGVKKYTIEELASAIAKEQAELNQLAEALGVIVSPPKYQPQPEQVPLLEQVQKLLSDQKTEAERQAAIAATEQVIAIAERRLEGLQAELARLELEKKFNEGKTQIREAVQQFNEAASQYQVAGDRLQALGREYGDTYQRSGVRLNIRDVSGDIAFAQVGENGSVAMLKREEMRQSDRIAFGLEPAPSHLRRVV